MRLRGFMVMMVMAIIFFITGILYAANGDLIVNGNLGVGTATPQGKAEVNGNMIVDGDTTMKGNTTTNGDTIVNGNLGVGTTTPQTKLDVNGGIAFTIDGKRAIPVYIDQNFGEDIYSAWVCSPATDTCGDPVNNNPGANMYTCLANEQRTCTDQAFNYASLVTKACPAGGYVSRTVVCKRPVVFVIP